ncbi:hypothetical protein Poly41_34850 [Novipirellula artificiosorum]|uniref:Uncharacterized protein n=1 Tax=Novipirellula artificiosorum TaxID=2528016 RepID=A0A5C6DMG3_9BACT|nr:hypothetical protein Poly41_34850 [Novipirellula artificiosorum]
MCACLRGCDAVRNVELCPDSTLELGLWRITPAGVVFQSLGSRRGEAAERSLGHRLAELYLPRGTFYQEISDFTLPLGGCAV